MDMRAVGLKVLKNRLSEYVRLAAHGETILIADRDRVVAELSPPRETRGALVADAALADLIRSGCLTPALSATGRPTKPPPVGKLDVLLAELVADRADR